MSTAIFVSIALTFLQDVAFPSQILLLSFSIIYSILNDNKTNIKHRHLIQTLLALELGGFCI